MKQRVTFYLILFSLVLPGCCWAQHFSSDSVPYKTGIYQVKKKKETILSVASKLNLDPQLISNLNDSSDVDKILVPGQKLIIPVYTSLKGRGNEKKDSKVNNNSRDKAVNERATPILAPSKLPEALIDTDLIENRILLSEATLDLNRALLQGIQASLDSLNVKDKVLIDEKNISATIHHMQRQRDKAMLTPVLLHMQDSLQTEIKREENEKIVFENMLGRNVPGPQRPDTASVPKVQVADTGLGIATERMDTSANKIVKADGIKVQPAKYEAVADTPVTSKVSNIYKADAHEPEHIRPVVEANPLPDTVTPPPPIMHWETAKAIYYSDDTGITGQNEGQPTVEIQGEGRGADTTAYKPGLKDTSSQSRLQMSDSARVIRAQYFFTKALKASNEKSYKEAAGNLKRAIDISPKYYGAWFALGEADAHLGFYTKAMSEFAHCKTLDSSHASLYYKIGTVQVKLKQESEAFHNFTRALKLDSNYVPAIISRAAEYVERNQLRTAIKEYGRVIKIDPSYHTVYKSKAMAEYDLQSYAAAIDDFTRFLIFTETDGSVYYYRGMAKLKGGALIDACTDLSVSARLGYQAALKAMEINCK